MIFSPVISGSPAQLTLTIDQGISRRNESLRDVVKTGIYQHGLTRMANELHIPAGNLCNQINGSGQRHLSVDSLDRYMEVTGDMAPIHYLVERFMVSKTDEQAAALAQAKRLIDQLTPLMGKF